MNSQPPRWEDNLHSRNSVPQLGWDRGCWLRQSPPGWTPQHLCLPLHPPLPTPLTHPSSMGIPWLASWHAPWHHLPANNSTSVSHPPAETDGFGYRGTQWMAVSCGAVSCPPHHPPPHVLFLCCQGNAGITLLARSRSLFPTQACDFPVCCNEISIDIRASCWVLLRSILGCATVASLFIQYRINAQSVILRALGT